MQQSHDVHLGKDTISKVNDWVDKTSQIITLLIPITWDHGNQPINNKNLSSHDWAWYASFT